MDRIKKNFGFGCMRLPVIGEDIDIEEMKKMVDIFLEEGFNYFDTARVYHKGKSELALKEALTSRYPRDAYILTDKLTKVLFENGEDIEAVLDSQLEACGVDYFDFYLMHSQSRDNFDFFVEHKAYEKAFELKSKGKVRHVGLSFHDTSDVLDRILTKYPEVEVVQLQFNYLDYGDAVVDAGRNLEVCRKHGKPVIVMEPVKGGRLANLPEEAESVFRALGGGSSASYALRYAAGFDGIFMVLSGMGSMAMMTDNISAMKDFKPLGGEELSAVEKVKDIILSKNAIPCTGCKYCVDGCPMNIAIPELFSSYNARREGNEWSSSQTLGRIRATGRGLASACIECGQCESVCPQHLPIIKLLRDAAGLLEG